MQRTLQIEMIQDRENPRFPEVGSEELMKMFSALLTDSFENMKFVGRASAADSEITVFDVKVSDEVFDSFFCEYGVFLENYFGHIPMGDYAVKSIKVEDAKAVNERLQKFLSDFSFDLQKVIC